MNDVLLTDDEILDAYASEETAEFLSGSRGIAKAQLKKVGEIYKSIESGYARRLFMEALLKEVECGTKAR